MANDSLDIDIDANVGGAVTAMDSMAESVAGLNVKVANLGESFQRPLESIGIHTFGVEMARSIGITGSMRPVMLAMKIAVESAGDAFGVTGTAIGGYLLIAAAVAAIVYKIVEAHKSEAEKLEKLNVANTDAIQKNNDLVKSLQEYETATGSLTPAMEKQLAATVALTKAKLADEVQTIGGQVAATKELIATNEKQLAQMQAVITKTAAFGARMDAAAGSADTYGAHISALNKKLEALKMTNLENVKTLSDQEAHLEAVRKGFATETAEVKAGTDAANANKEAQKALDDAAQKLSDKVAHQTEASIKANEAFTLWGENASAKTAEVNAKTAELLGSMDGIPNEYAKMQNASSKFYSEELKHLDDEERKGMFIGSERTQVEKQQAAARVAIADQEAAAKIASVYKWFGASVGYTKNLSQFGSSQFNAMASSFGGAVGKMVAGGQNFYQATRGLLQTMATDAIAGFSEMSVKWAAAKAFEVVTGKTAATTLTAAQTAATAAQVNIVGAGATAMLPPLQAVADAEALALGPIAGPLAEADINELFFPLYAMAVPKGFALGGDFITDRPMSMMVGEGGQPERVTVSPISSGGGSSGGATGPSGGMSFTFGDINIQGITDPRKLADQIALLITQAIRGRGQLNMTGASIY